MCLCFDLPWSEKARLNILLSWPLINNFILQYNTVQTWELKKKNVTGSSSVKTNCYKHWRPCNVEIFKWRMQIYSFHYKENPCISNNNSEASILYYWVLKSCRFAKHQPICWHLLQYLLMCWFKLVIVIKVQVLLMIIEL